MSERKSQETSVSEAFSAQSPKFDSITTANPMEVLYRDLVRAHVLQYARAGEKMLELNCGTGLDALFFAGKGLYVHATDNAEGMLAQLAQKLKVQPAPAHVSYQRCSFNDLSPLDPAKKFGHVFSNFGGLNCAEDLKVVTEQLDPHLEKNGMVHFVMIAPLCPWEWLAVLKGRFRYAFRRLGKNGLRSHLEGHYFKTYYYSFSQLKKAFGHQYEVLQLRSLGCFLPPTFKENFPAQWPALFKVLKKMELLVNTSWPFNRVGDLYIVSLKRKN